LQRWIESGEAAAASDHRRCGGWCRRKIGGSFAGPAENFHDLILDFFLFGLQKRLIFKSTAKLPGI
jgi:hypothetical protein